MVGSFFKPFKYIIILIMILTIFICMFFMPTIQADFINNIVGEEIVISDLGFAWPIPGYNVITSYFGKRNSPTAGASSYHKGLDIGAPIGTPVKAAASGIVTFAGFKGSYGYLLVISHGNGTETYYGHCSKLYASVGQNVSQGEVVAAVGNTGNSTGPHLHLEIRINGVAYNPQNYLYK